MGRLDPTLAAHLAPVAAPMPQGAPQGGNQLASYLPSLLAAGASFIPGVGTVAAAGLGGIGEIARQKMAGEDFDLGKVGMEAGLSAIPGGLGQVGKLAKLAKGVNVTAKGFKAAKGATQLGDTLTTLPKSQNIIQKGLNGLGDTLSIKGLRLNPSQQAKYAASAGEDVAATLNRYKLQGASADDIAAKADEIQASFDTIAKNTDVRIPSAAIQTHLKDVLAPLKNSTIAEHKALAQKIEDEMGDVLKKAGDGKATLADLNKMRQEYDAATKSFAGDPIMSGKVRAIGSVLRKTVQSVADSAGLKTAGGATLKDTGRELSKLYDLAEMSGKQDYLGRGSSPLNLLTLVGGAGGGLPGMAATAAINSKPVIRAAAKAATTLGKVSGPTLPGKEKLARAALIGSDIPGHLNDAQTSEDPNATMFDPTAIDPTLDPSTTPQASPGSLTPEMLQSAYQQILAEPDGTRRKSMIAELKSLVELQDTINPAAKAPKPLSAEGSKQVANATSGLKAINQLKSALQTDPNVANTNAAAGLFGNLGQGAAGTQSFEAAKNEIIDVISRSRSGAALTEAEINNYKRALPRFGDSPEVAQQKLARFEAMFSQILELQQQGSPDMETLGLTGLQ